MTTWLILGDPEWAPLQAFASGLRSFGVDCVWRDHGNHGTWSDVDCDAVAIYGLRAQGRDILDHFQRRGTPVVVIDHGFMRRVHTINDFPTGHFYVGMNRLGWVPDAAPADRFEALGVTVATRPARPIRRALIMGQVPHDASHRLGPAELTNCYERLADELMHMGARAVAFRPHPSPQSAPVQPAIRRDDLAPLEDAINRADLVVSINSNAGLDAIIAGCPAVTMMVSHYGALAYRWPVRLAAITAPSPAQVTAHLHRLAYAQWTLAEISEGLPQRFLHSIGAIP